MDENVCIWKLGISALLLMLYYMWLATGSNKFSFILICMYQLCQGNSISTTKFNFFTFLPKGLFEQVNYFRAYWQ